MPEPALHSARAAKSVVQLMQAVAKLRAVHRDVQRQLHKMTEALEQADILTGTDKPPATTVMDQGYRGAGIKGVSILISGQKLGIT